MVSFADAAAEAMASEKRMFRFKIAGEVDQYVVAKTEKQAKDGWIEWCMQAGLLTISRMHKRDVQSNVAVAFAEMMRERKLNEQQVRNSEAGGSTPDHGTGDGAGEQGGEGQSPTVRFLRANGDAGGGDRLDEDHHN